MMVVRLEGTVERLWAEIEARRDELVGVIADLVRRPSLLGEEGPAQAYVADYLRASGDDDGGLGARSVRSLVAKRR